MPYQVPQFIEFEDKIFGPMTLKQGLYLMGGAGLSFVIYVFIGNLYISLLPILVVMGVSVSLAFYKVYNHFPLISVAESAFKYWLGGKLYIWKKEEKVKQKKIDSANEDIKNYASIMVPKISDSKLKDLSWSLDIKESLYSNKNQK